MIIVKLTYKKPLETVDKFLAEHIDFLERYYAQKRFLASGRRENRIGGVIIVLSDNLNEVKNIMRGDPFHKNDIADYEYIQFNPTNYLPELSPLLTK